MDIDWENEEKEQLFNECNSGVDMRMKELNEMYHVGDSVLVQTVEDGDFIPGTITHMNLVANDYDPTIEITYGNDELIYLSPHEIADSLKLVKAA